MKKFYQDLNPVRYAHPGNTINEVDGYIIKPCRKCVLESLFCRAASCRLLIHLQVGIPPRLNTQTYPVNIPAPKTFKICRSDIIRIKFNSDFTVGTDILRIF